jgi:hypothetical protein
VRIELLQRLQKIGFSRLVLANDAGQPIGQRNQPRIADIAVLENAESAELHPCGSFVSFLARPPTRVIASAFGPAIEEMSLFVRASCVG